MAATVTADRQKKLSKQGVNPLLEALRGGGCVLPVVPRFYFHLHGPNHRLRDGEGVTLPDAEAAWFQAVRSAREVVRADLQLGCSWEGRMLAIEDERGLPVDQIPLQEIAQFGL